VVDFKRHVVPFVTERKRCVVFKTIIHPGAVQLGFQLITQFGRVNRAGHLVCQFFNGPRRVRHAVNVVLVRAVRCREIEMGKLGFHGVFVCV
jgi:hypothetical protein